MDRKYDFVNVTGHLDSKDPGYRKAVRASATRTFRRDERLRRIATIRTSEARTPHESASSTSPYADEDIAFPHDPLSHVGNASLDSFKSMSLQLSDAHQSLLSHFDGRIGPIIIPQSADSQSSWSSVWLTQAISDPLLLTATCCHASTHMDYLRGAGQSQTTLHFRQMAITKIQHAVQSDSGIPSEITIAAVLMLVADSLIAGDTSELAVHCSAIRQMVQLRRGRFARHAFGSLVETCIGWNVAPIAVLLQAIQQEQKAVMSQLPAPSFRWERETNISSMLERYGHLHTRLQELRSDKPETTDHWSVFVRDRNCFEYDLVHRWQSLIDGEHSIDRQISRLVSLALLVCSLHRLRNFHTRAPVLCTARALLVREVLSLKGCSLLELLSPQLRDLAWAGAVVQRCSIESEDLEDLQTFMEEIVETLHLREIVDTE